MHLIIVVWIGFRRSYIKKESKYFDVDVARYYQEIDTQKKPCFINTDNLNMLALYGGKGIVHPYCQFLLRKTKSDFVVFHHLLPIFEKKNNPDGKFPDWAVCYFNCLLKELRWCLCVSFDFETL